jgi:methionyl aminopeptidase
MNLPDVYIDKDGWSVYTKDGGKCATFEHMVIVRKDKAEVISSEV